MKNLDKNLRLYSISLLLVAAFFIVIGGISLSRNATDSENKFFQNFNAKEKAASLSDENLSLQESNKVLTQDVENLQKELNKSNESNENLTKLIKASVLADDGEIEKATDVFASVDSSLLSDEQKVLYEKTESTLKGVNDK